MLSRCIREKAFDTLYFRKSPLRVDGAGRMPVLRYQEDRGFERVSLLDAGHAQRKGFLAAQQMAVVRVDSEAGDVQFRTVRVVELSGMV